MAEEDILAQAASTTQQMIPQQKDLLSFGPETIKQPPPLVRPNQDLFRPQIAQGGFASSGARKRADKQAMFNNVANMVKAGTDFFEQKKQRGLTMDIETLISAQQGLEEAKQSQDQDAIKKNTEIINNITSDPKKLKNLQKAFNIDLFGGGKNKKENQALMDAWKNTHKGELNPAAQRLMASQPVRQQLSPEAQAQAMAIKAGLAPKAGEVLKAYQENYKTIQTAKTSEERNAAIENAAKLRATATQYHADKIADAMDNRTLGMQYSAEIRMKAEKYKADLVAQTWDKRLAKMDDWAKMKTGDSPIFKKLIGEAKTYNDRLKELSTDTKSAQVELDKASPSAIGKFFGARMTDNADTKMLKNKIMMNNLEMKQIQQDLQGVTKKMQFMDTAGIINIKELSAGSSGGSGDSGGEEDSVNVSDTEVPE